MKIRTLALLILTTFVMSCENLPADLPPGDFTSPQYWGDYYLDKYEDERDLYNTVIEEGPDSLEQPRTVLLVTGVTIPGEWFNGIRTRLERDGFRVVLYVPRDLLSYDLFEASQDLADVAERVRDESGEEKIDILAECTGGLIARYYVQSLGGDETINRLVTFVSPQNGIALAPKAAKFAKWPALYDLSPGSDFLNAVQAEPLPENVDMTSIYACDDEYIKPYETSIVEGATNIGLCDESEFMGHFRTMFDPEVYLIMHDALTAPLSFAPEIEEQDEEGDQFNVPNVQFPNNDTVDEDDDSIQSANNVDVIPDVDPDYAGCSTTGSNPVSLVWLLIAMFGIRVSRRRDDQG